MRMTTWNAELANAQLAIGDGTAIVARAPDDDSVWSKEFDGGFGLAEGKAVLAWSETHVYFPVVYDGSEWLGSAPRNPQVKGQEHVGGE